MPRRNSQNSSKAKRPSPPLTAYNLYFRHERARLLSTGKLIEDLSPDVQITSVDLRDFMAKNPYQSPASRQKRSHSKTHGAISFADLSRTVSRNWKALDDDSREPFLEVAHELKVEHYRTIEDERQRAKQDKIIDAICEDPVEAGASALCVPALVVGTTTVQKKLSTALKLIRAAPVISEEAGPLLVERKRDLPPIMRVSVLVTPPAKKARVGLGGGVSPALPGPPPPVVVSLPEMPPLDDLFSLDVSAASGMGQSKMLPLLDGPAIEPIDIRRNAAHDGCSLILEKDFADAWLAGTTTQKWISELTYDKMTGGGLVGVP